MGTGWWAFTALELSEVTSIEGDPAWVKVVKKARKQNEVEQNNIKGC